MTPRPLEAIIPDITDAYHKANSILVLAGAGMGVDAGIGTFRGSAAGVWPGMEKYKAELPLAPDGSEGLSQMNDKRWFGERPEMAWEFWRWCYEGYSGEPHQGYGVLKEMLFKGGKEGYVVTTNIDSHFEKAGVPAERLREVHGVVKRVVCSGAGRDQAEPAQVGSESDLRPLDFAEDFAENEVTDDTPCGYTTTFAGAGFEPVPRCSCTAVLRPDVTLFGDRVWHNNPPPGPLLTQLTTYRTFITQAPPPLLILEIGAGTKMPFLRKLGKELVTEREGGVCLVRVNPGEAEVEGGISVPYGAGEVLRKLGEALNLS